MKHINVEEFQKVIEEKQGDESVDFINVCTPAEYAAEHIEGVRSVPLDELDSHLAEFADKQTVYIHCRSGGRGMMAMSKLKDLGVKAELVNVEGGLMAWGGAGYKTNSLH